MYKTFEDLLKSPHHHIPINLKISIQHLCWKSTLRETLWWTWSPTSTSPGWFPPSWWSSAPLCCEGRNAPQRWPWWGLRGTCSWWSWDSWWPRPQWTWDPAEADPPWVSLMLLGVARPPSSSRSPSGGSSRHTNKVKHFIIHMFFFYKRCRPSWPRVSEGPHRPAGSSERGGKVREWQPRFSRKLSQSLWSVILQEYNAKPFSPLGRYGPDCLTLWLLFLWDDGEPSIRDGLYHHHSLLASSWHNISLHYYWIICTSAE